MTRVMIQNYVKDKTLILLKVRKASGRDDNEVVQGKFKNLPPPSVLQGKSTHSYSPRLSGSRLLIAYGQWRQFRLSSPNNPRDENKPI